MGKVGKRTVTSWTNPLKAAQQSGAAIKGAFKPDLPSSEPTAEETMMRSRQMEELARLDSEENRRLKGLARTRLGGRSLLGGALRGGKASTTGDAAAVGGGGSSGGSGSGGGGGSGRRGGYVP